MASHQANGDLLSSWKEIADYLGCDERTCRRWELRLRLPVHRMEGSAKSRVYAYKCELDSWRDSELNGTPRAEFGVEFKPEAARPQFRSTKRRILWLIPVAAGVLAAVLYLAWPAPREPSDFRIKNSNLIIVDKKGKELWGFDTRLDNLISEESYRARFQTRARAPSDEPLLPYLVIRELSPSRIRQVLFCPKTKGEYYETGLFCIDERGKILWHYKPGRELNFGSRQYSGDYRIFGIEPHDINNDGYLEVFLITAHQPHSPSGLVVLDCRGNVLGEFMNWGRIADFALVDFDGDGVTEVAIAGQNDEYGKGCLAVFKATQIYGSSPQSPDYSCTSCGNGSEEYYILFPRTDVDLSLNPEKEALGAIHLLQNKRIEVSTLLSHIFFELDFSFKVQDVKGSDSYRAAHRELLAAGKIKSELSDAYFDDLKKGVLYWNGIEWTSSPSMNLRSR